MLRVGHRVGLLRVKLLVGVDVLDTWSGAWDARWVLDDVLKVARSWVLEGAFSRDKVRLLGLLLVLMLLLGC